jgi:copper resistance protein C
MTRGIPVLLLIGLLAPVTLVLAAHGAMAHAFLERARPGAGSQLRAAPTAVSITFTERVEPRFSQIEVMDAQGTRVDAGDLHAGADGKTLVVGLGSLPPGRYAVKWQVLSVDTHKTQGDYDFTVAP